ncbi:hypothetical protein E2C01_026225 [Portunus trituberculatus]|uniref:Uncharacterized protein n=1 Tax=Portunus trituberculatus TaxID=210409 RepID=A0A5B7EF52_PORTR|nr:hypothetical protein [Portunus trituberculatus]
MFWLPSSSICRPWFYSKQAPRSAWWWWRWRLWRKEQEAVC